MDLLVQVLIPLLIIGGIVYLFTRRYRERAGNAPLRGEIEARVCFEAVLDRASILGTGGFEGTRGVWIPLRGPKRLTVGTDAFMVSAPQVLREFVFRGPESSVVFGQAVNPDDCIMITWQAGGRQVQLAITGGDLPDIWQALAATGAALVLRVVNSESSSGACCNSSKSFVVGVVVPPDDVPADHAGLLFVAGVVGAVQREVAQRCELRLY